MNLKKTLLILGLLLYSIHVFSQNEKIFYNNGIFWNKNEFAQFFEDKPYGIGLDVIHRRGTSHSNNNPFERHLRTSLRPWFHYQFGPDARLSISPIGYFMTNEYEAMPFDVGRPSSFELRSTVQFFHHHKQMAGKIMHTWRYRLEFRNRMTEGSDEFVNFARFRFRYRFRYIERTRFLYTRNVVH